MNQKYTSANTSVNSTKLPKTFTFVKDWSEGTVNLDDDALMPDVFGN